MPPTPTLHHVALTVTDLDRSVDWYQRLLGLEEVVERDGPTWRRRLVRGGDFSLSLSVHDTTDPADRFDETRVGMEHVAIGCTDRAELDAWLDHADALGIERADVTEAPHAWVIALKDPDGIPIEFFCPR